MSLSKQDVMGAVARGWCHPETEKTVMDPELAMAITDEVVELLLDKVFRFIEDEGEDG